MRRLIRSVSLVGYGAAILLVVAGTLALADSAGAAPVIDGGMPGVLVIDADPALMTDQQMEPGDILYWPITTRLEVADSGSLHLRVEHVGTLASTPGGIELGIQKCRSAWSTAAVPTCPVGATTVFRQALATLPSGSLFDLGTIRHDSGPYFLATVALPDTVPSALQGTQATIALGFTALGDDATVIVPLGGLPNTGATIGGPLLLGAGLVLAGLVLAGLVFARQRGRVDRQRHSVVTS